MSLRDKYPNDLITQAVHPADMRDFHENSPQLYRLVVPFSYVTDDFRIDVPAGFETDFASIPAFALSFCDDDDPRVLYPSVIHDYMYVQLGKCGDYTFTREETDKVFYDAMIKCNMDPVRARIIYRAVRLGGGKVWNRHLTDPNTFR